MKWGIVVATVMAFMSVVAHQEYLVACRNIEARDLLNEALSGEQEQFSATLERGIHLLNGEGFMFYGKSINPYLTATFYSMLANNEAESGKRQQFLDNTLQNYLLHLKVQPTHGPAWAAAAVTKIQSGQLDSDLEHYIENAYQVGNHDPKTHMKMAIVAYSLLRTNVEINPAISDILLHHLSVGLKNPKSKIAIFYSVMERDGIREKICTWKNAIDSAEILKCPKAV